MEFGKVSTKDATAPSRGGIERHKRDGRPKIYPEGGGKGEFYTRVTTFIDCIDDKSTLGDWKLRQVLKGLARRPDYLDDYKKISDPDGVDKWKALKVAERAMEAAGAGYRASAGTEMHDAIENTLLGKPHQLPPDLAHDVTAFVQVVASMGLELVDTEVFAVNDELKTGGSMDYLFRWEGAVIIGDTKTGRPYYGKTAMQEAIYANSFRYDPETFERSPLTLDGPFSPERGLFIHVPLGEGRCEVRVLDLKQGWEDVRLAAQVREVRKRWNRKADTPKVLAEYSCAG